MSLIIYKPKPTLKVYGYSHDDDHIREMIDIWAEKGYCKSIVLLFKKRDGFFYFVVKLKVNCYFALLG